jgi:hypothetical protein
MERSCAMARGEDINIRGGHFLKGEVYLAALDLGPWRP